ncbi:MAG: TPM domain-containing protein, partial [Candidatus Yanofskybacteria bacterium]|nr:TPM domain-containing protein [Candidatus Yanofskybacteria bacterium]
MKVLVGILAMFVLVSPASGQTIPNLYGYVNDFADIISDKTETDLDQWLHEYDQRTTNQLLVVTVTSLEGLTVDDYAAQLFTKAKPGQKGKNNGLIILIALRERKMKI